MTSKTTRQFWELYERLPLGARELAIQKYGLWVADNGHKSLAFRTVSGRPHLWRVSIGDHYRAVALKTQEGYVWFWIGTHAEYDRLLR